jgi:hypothetical protein
MMRTVFAGQSCAEAVAVTRKTKPRKRKSARIA